MELTKIEVVDLIEVIENGCVQVRIKSVFLEDGVRISGTFHRHVVAPGDDYSSEDVKVQDICAAVHTPKVVAAYKAEQEAAQLPQG